LLGSLWFNSFSAGGGGGGASDYELIQTQILASTATTVTFSSIPSTYRHLQLRMTTRSSSSGNVHLRMNSDTGANYSFHRLTGDSSYTFASYGLSARNFITLENAATSTSIFTASVLDVLDYTQTTKNTTIRSFSGRNESGSSQVSIYSGAWYSTAAVTTLSLSDYTSGSSFAIGSRFSLYGLK
jgi:hypothetical protein